MRIRIVAPFLLVLLPGTSARLAAELTTADRKEILDYKLSMPVANKLLVAMPAMTQYVLTLPDLKTRMQRASKESLAQRTAVLEQDPKGMAIVKQNGLRAHDYTVGVVALRMALWKAAGNASPSMIVSPENLAFARANLKELKPKMDAADGVKR